MTARSQMANQLEKESKAAKGTDYTQGLRQLESSDVQTGVDNVATAGGVATGQTAAVTAAAIDTAKGVAVAATIYGRPKTVACAPESWDGTGSPPDEGAANVTINVLTAYADKDIIGASWVRIEGFNVNEAEKDNFQARCILVDDTELAWQTYASGDQGLTEFVIILDFDSPTPYDADKLIKTIEVGYKTGAAGNTAITAQNAIFGTFGVDTAA